MTDQEYWDKAAADPDVDQKYIANIDLNECLKAIRPGLQPGLILEIGSGVGRLSIPLARPAQNTIVGVDISVKMRKIAVNRAVSAGADRCRFIDVDAFRKLESKSFDSAYSMLTFQHIDPADVRWYIQEVGRLLRPSGTFRFQFVEGKFHAPQDHNYSMATISRMCGNAGFIIESVEKGLILPQWTWITVIRRSW